MEFLKPEDQKLVPIPVVENIIREIHEINANIHRLNSRAPMEISSPPRLVETKKSSYYESPVRRGREQDAAIKLAALHDKVNKVLSRSGSPARISHTEDLKRSYPVPRRTEEAYRSNQTHQSIRLNDMHNQIDKVLARSRSGSPARVQHVEESIVLTRTGEPVRASPAVRLNSALRHSSVQRSPAYANKVESFSTYANNYEREVVKRSAAAYTPVRTRPAYDYSSPLKSSIPGTSITRIASIPLYDYDRRSSLTTNSTAFTASPTKMRASGAHSSYSDWPSSAGYKYDQNRIDDVVNKIMARKSVENALNNSGLGRRGSTYTATAYQPVSSHYLKRY